MGKIKVKVTKKQFGKNWPFKINQGTLIIDKVNAIYLKVGLKNYGVNGIAINHGATPIDKIWKDNPDIPGAKINIGPFIDYALSLKNL